GQAAEDEAQMGVGFAEVLDQDPAQAVADQENAREKTRPPSHRREMEQQAEQHEEQQAFEGRFIELARMARQRAARGEDDAPGQVGRATKKLAIDEIGDAAKKQSDGRDTGDAV